MDQHKRPWRGHSPSGKTKSGKGNRLGLATVWTTATSNGGFVEVTSGNGVSGTEFRVYLPAHTDTPIPKMVSVVGADVFDHEWLEATKPVMLPKPYDPHELLRILGTLLGIAKQPE